MFPDKSLPGLTNTEQELVFTYFCFTARKLVQSDHLFVHLSSEPVVTRYLDIAVIANGIHAHAKIKGLLIFQPSPKTFRH